MWYLKPNQTVTRDRYISLPMPSTPDPEQIPDASGLSPKQIHYLKIANIIMGIILVVGFIALIYGLIRQAQKLTASPSKNNKIEKTIATTKNHSGTNKTNFQSLHQFKKQINLALLEGETVQNVWRSENLLQLVLLGPKSSRIVYLDLVSGQTVSIIHLRPKQKQDQ